jgi:hypothetical protein
MPIPRQYVRIRDGVHEMSRRIGYVVFPFLLIMCCAADFNPILVGDGALSGFKEILYLWRAENYEGLYSRLSHSPDQGWDYFAERIVYASRIPACCWEQLQEVETEALSDDRVVITAKVGMDAGGFGTRFVKRNFTMRLIDGVWKLPMGDVLELSRYNFQRIPRKIYPQ